MLFKMRQLSHSIWYINQTFLYVAGLLEKQYHELEEVHEAGFLSWRHRELNVRILIIKFLCIEYYMTLCRLKTNTCFCNRLVLTKWGHVHTKMRPLHNKFQPNSNKNLNVNTPFLSITFWGKLESDVGTGVREWRLRVDELFSLKKDYVVGKKCNKGF